jgi:hypothetical protein
LAAGPSQETLAFAAGVERNFVGYALAIRFTFSIARGPASR